MARKLKLLFVCSKNKWRSPTAEQIYQNDPLYEVRSAGTSASARRRLSAKDLSWADRVFVMEQKHKTRIRQQFPEQVRRTQFHVLEIEDRYHFMDPRLVTELQEAIAPILDDLR